MSGSSAHQPCVVLLSGGLDSAVCLAIARREGFIAHCLTLDYGQRHRCELASAARVAQSLGAASHIVVRLDLRAIGGSALTAAIDVPKASDSVNNTASNTARNTARNIASVQRVSAPSSAGEIPVTYVPARNLTFLSIAVGQAEVAGARDIFVGVNAVDYSGYPDCRPQFVQAFERVANLATKAGVEDAAPHFRVRAPLVELSKAQIIRVGAELGVDFAITHSCYDPVGEEGLACGACESCRLRRAGFVEAGVRDATTYAPLALHGHAPRNARTHTP